MADDRDCPYCDLDGKGVSGPVGGWIYRDEYWLAGHGPADTTMTGALKVTSRRHYVDFAEMTVTEAASIGPLLVRLDGALRAVTDAERVHVVSTRDRIQLHVTDLDAEVRRLDTAGAAMRSAIITGRGGLQNPVDDPSGNSIELFQPAP